MSRHRGEYKVRLMAQVLQVSPAGYYAWRKRTTPSQRMIADEILMGRIRIVFSQSHGRYGSPRVQHELKESGYRVGRKRVARLMRKDGLVARRRKKRRPQTTDSNHSYRIAPNLLARKFDVNGIRINRFWLSDITYIPTGEGTLYLASTLDLGSRRCVGWSMSDRIDAELVVSALRMAVAARNPKPGLMHHSDQGSQYACDDFRNELEAHGMTASMSRKGDCWDNAVAESFFATLEMELIAKSKWRTRAEARLAVFEFIESWYNRVRRHSTLGNIAPVEYEKRSEKAA
jgi:putative transposase